jgi:hypothetical protein
MSYNQTGTRGIARRIGGKAEVKPKESKAKENKKTKAPKVDGINEGKKTKRDSGKKISNNGGKLKRLSKSQMDRLKEHSKLHKGGMGSKHIRKMIFVMTKEGKSFNQAHKIAMKFDKMKK